MSYRETGSNKKSFKEGFNLFKKLLKKPIALLSAALMVAMSAMATSASAAPIDFTTAGTLTVDPVDVVKTGFSFVGLFDQYTLLVLGVIFAPVAIGFIIWLWRKLPKFGGGKA